MPMPILHISYVYKNVDEMHGFGAVLLYSKPPRSVDEYKLIIKRIIEEEFDGDSRVQLAILSWQLLVEGDS